MDLLAFVLALQAEGKTAEEVRAAVNQYLEDNPGAIDQAAVEAILDGRLDEIVLAQQNQPTSEDNRIWFPTTEGGTVQVPTYEEHRVLESAIEDLEAGSLSALGATAGQVPTADGAGSWEWATPSGGGGDVTDVQVNGTSVVTDGVANVPIATPGAIGLVKPTSTYGVNVLSGGFLGLVQATNAQIKNGSGYSAIFPSNQEKSTFYGLAKAAGDTTQSQSNNEVGNYTEEAKSAIKKMLGIYDGIQPSVMNPEAIQAIVANEEAKKYFNIGDVIYIPWTNYTPSTPVVYQFPFVVVHIGDVYDQNNVLHHDALWLMAMYAEPEEIVFDAAEDTVVDLSTEPNALEGWYYWGLTGTDYTELQLSTGDAIPTTYDSVHKCAINNLSVLRYGYNRWRDSAYRQWLNSDAAKNANWWTSQHEGDIAPTSTYTNKPGWLYGFENRWLDVIKPVKVQTACNTVTNGGVTDITYDRFFLPSLEQMYGNPQAAGVEGDYWEYWKEETGLDAPSNGSSSDPNEARKIPSVVNYPRGSAVHCRLRSAYRGNGHYVWYVYTGGYLINYYAYSAHRSLPACVIY